MLPRPGEIINDLYRLKDVYASGGMGVIMKAEQIRIGRDVAVKLLHPHVAARQQLKKRFMREVQVTTLFDHANIVRVYDVGETEEGALYLVMELLEGEELEDIIAREAPLSVQRTIDIGLQMLDGLGEAHSRGVVHRDLKPSNVFVTKSRHGEDEIKLLDFGIAKLIQSKDTKLTATGRLTGTPAYVAPETMLGIEDINKKAADVYAAGLVIVEMLIGREVYQGATVAQTLLQHLKKPVVIPEAIDETPLGEVLRKSTAKHPEDRYQDGDEMYLALAEAREGTSLELRLTPEQIPDPVTDNSPGLIEELERQGSDVDLSVLRNVPQHESFKPSEQSGTSSKKGSSSNFSETGSIPGRLKGSASNRVIVDAPLIAEKRQQEREKEASGSQGIIRDIAGSSLEIILVLAILVGAWLLFDPFNRDAQQAVSDSGQEEVPQAVPDLDSEPRGAEVWVLEQMIGRTPLNWGFEFEEDDLPVEVTFKMEGYEDHTEIVEDNEAREFDVALQQLDGEGQEVEE